MQSLNKLQIKLYVILQQCGLALPKSIANPSSQLFYQRLHWLQVFFVYQLELVCEIIEMLPRNISLVILWE